MPKIELKDGPPNYSFDMPSPEDWLQLGLDEALEIRERTESRGRDVNDNEFKAYSVSYAKYREEKGRSTWPNLSFTGKMLGSLGAGVSSGVSFAKITLSGTEGFKAWSNEAKEREFLGMTEERQVLLAEKISEIVIKSI